MALANKTSKNSIKAPAKEPQIDEDFIQISSKIPSVEEMFKAGVHFGHKTSKWNPKMKAFIFSVHNNIHIIDLEKTVGFLKEAIDFVKKIVAQGGKVLFVGTKPSSKNIIEQVAKLCQMPYVSERWLGGTLTNYKTIKKRLDYLKGLEQKKKEGQLQKYTKKERLLFEREMTKMHKQFGGLIEMAKLPDVLFVADIKDNVLAVREARCMGIPVIGICDTNSDPTLIDHPIPANDDAISSLRLIVETIAGAIKEVQESLKRKVSEKSKKATEDKSSTRK